MSFGTPNRVATNSGITQVSSFTATLTSAIAAHHLIIVNVACANVGNLSNISSITDTAGNTYVSAGFTVDGGQNSLVAVWIAKDCLACNSGDTITITLGATLLAGGSWIVAVDEVSGAATASVTDGENGTSGQDIAAPTTWTTGNITTTNASDMLWVAMGNAQNEPAAITQAGSAPSSGWTIATGLTNGPSNHNGLRTAYQVVSSTGTYSGGGTAQAFGSGVSAVIIAFKSNPVTDLSASAGVVKLTAQTTTLIIPVALSASAGVIDATAQTATLITGPGVLNVQPAVVKLAAPTATLHVVGLPPPPMPRISVGVPADASNTTFAASRANNTTWGDFWQSVTAPSVGTPHWVAYDLSGVASGSRSKVLVALYNEQGDYNQASGAAADLFKDYKIQGNTAAFTGGVAPSAGWVDLVSVTGNTYPTRHHALDLTGYSSIRFICTAALQAGDFISLQMDVHDAHLSQPASFYDSWLFAGDSITRDGMLHPEVGGGDWGYGGALADIIHAARSSYYPQTIDGGFGGMTAATAATQTTALLANFVGGFVSIAYGTNDANVGFTFTAGDTNVTTYYSNLLTLIDAAAALGAIVVVPHIPWGSANSGNLGTNAKLLNDYVDAHLPADRPRVMRGPDFWAYFNANQTLIQGDGIHPTFTEVAGAASGYEQMHALWATWMLTNIYIQPPVDLPAQPGTVKLTTQNAQLAVAVQLQTSPALAELVAVGSVLATTVGLRASPALIELIAHSIAFAGTLTGQRLHGVTIVRPASSSLVAGHNGLRGTTIVRGG